MTPTQLGTSIDANQRITKTLPAGAATATTATALNLGPQGGRNQPLLNLQLTIPATPGLANAATNKAALTDCDTEGGSYAAVLGFDAMLMQTGAGGVGAAANAIIIPVPPHARQFVKAAVTASAAGDQSAVSFIFETVLGFSG